jgi:hypothetical protein
LAQRHGSRVALHDPCQERVTVAEQLIPASLVDPLKVFEAEPGTVQLREGVPPDDIQLFLRSAGELGQLAAMASGLLVLSPEDLHTIIERP